MLIYFIVVLANDNNQVNESERADGRDNVKGIFG